MRCLLLPNFATMVGWHIILRRKAHGTKGEELATWQAGVHGLAWLDALMAQGEAEQLHSGGYPNCYRVRAGAVLPVLKRILHDARPVWRHGASDVINPHWKGRTTVNNEAIDRCTPAEWLELEAWDES